MIKVSANVMVIEYALMNVFLAFLSLCTYATTARVPLTMLHVVGSSITKKSGVLSFSLLAKSEKVTKHIRSLDLSNSNIGNEGLAALAEFLSKCEVLAELKLHAVGIFDPVWSGLPTSLMHLEADLNKLGSERSNNIVIFDNLNRSSTLT